MIRFIRDLRLLPIALIASACLPALKTADLVLDGGGYLMISGAAPPEDGDAALVRAMSDVPQGGGGQGRTRRPAQDQGTADHHALARIGPEGADPLPDRRLAGAVSE
jgi:hypothetical protein